MSKKIISLLLMLVMLVGCFASCGLFGGNNNNNNNPGETTGIKTGTYRTFTSVLPTNWNELTYQDNNDTQILSYIGSSFFEYDYDFDESKGGKFNEDGTVNADAIVAGGFTTNYLAATKMEDVTATVDAKWGYTDKQKADGGYAWKITLREDLKWDDGTPIDAYDFIYSMKEQLNPLFMNYRADTYYNSILVKNAKAYLFSETDFTYESVASQGFEKNADAIAEGHVIYIDMFNFYGAEGAPSITSYDETTYVPVLNFDKTCEQWVAYTDETLFFDYGYFVSTVAELEAEINAANKEAAGDAADEYVDITFDVVGEDGSVNFTNALALLDAYNTMAGADNPDYSPMTLADFYFSAAMIWGAYYRYFEVGVDYSAYAALKVENTNKVKDFADVGLYAPSQYELVLCMDSPVAALKEDGSLSYLAAYYLSSLPLVKEDLYESCKQAPAKGSTLWTTNYNSSLETSASWGPYKLAQYQDGKSYTLVRNDNWFGYGLETNKNQYNVTKIACEVVADSNSQWMGFLAGQFDSIGIDTNHLDYTNSKYAIINYGSTAYGIQLYSNLDVLKGNGRNNGILAIQDFRQALSLAMNRDDFNKTVFGTLPSSYGLIGEGYYSDIENGIVYRDTVQAKKVLLRTYGFTENEDGTWTDGINTYMDVDSAYEGLNGYNPTKAKELLLSAYNELMSDTEKYGYDPSKKIVLLYGATNSSDTSTKKKDFMQKLVNELTAGTPLEGQIEIQMDTSVGSDWADMFREGAYELCIIAGIGGNVFNPFNTIGAFVHSKDNLKYSTWWDSSLENHTFTMPEGDYDGAGETITMSIDNWYYCLNGLADAYDQPKKYNWNANVIPNEARLEVLAMLEEYALGKFFSIQCSFDAEMALDSAKFSNISEEYNTFMGYGGIRYSIVNYTDSEWNAFVKSNNNNLEAEYKKS